MFFCPFQIGFLTQGRPDLCGPLGRMRMMVLWGGWVWFKVSSLPTFVLVQRMELFENMGGAAFRASNGVQF